MIIELERNGKVLLRVHIWYLALSAILKLPLLFKPGENWQDANLFLCIPGLEGERRTLVPQPPEFKLDRSKD